MREGPQSVSAHLPVYDILFTKEEGHMYNVAVTY